jgi:hypothetical protein
VEEWQEWRSRWRSKRDRREGGGCWSGVGLKDGGGVAGVEDAMEEQKRPARRWRILEWSCIKGRWRSGRSGGRNGEAKGTDAGGGGCWNGVR